MSDCVSSLVFERRLVVASVVEVRLVRPKELQWCSVSVRMAVRFVQVGSLSDMLVCRSLVKTTEFDHDFVKRVVAVALRV